jgi:hypothetical protein
MISGAVKNGGAAIFVIQDSYYKNVHNDLAKIFVDFADHYSLKLRRRVDFPVSALMSTRHKHIRTYRENIRATESVLCFEKER